MSYDVSDVLVMSDEHMPSISTSLPHQINMTDYPHLCDIENPLLALDRIDLLLGINNCHLFKAMGSTESESSGLFAEQSRLGWTLRGRLDSKREITHQTFNLTVSNPNRYQPPPFLTLTLTSRHIAVNVEFPA